MVFQWNHYRFPMESCKFYCGRVLRQGFALNVGDQAAVYKAVISGNLRIFLLVVVG